MRPRTVLESVQRAFIHFFMKICLNVIGFINKKRLCVIYLFVSNCSFHARQCVCSAGAG